MGLGDFLGKMASSAVDKTKEYASEMNEAYYEASSLSDDELIRKWRNSYNQAKKHGYAKACKERGLNPS